MNKDTLAFACMVIAFAVTIAAIVKAAQSIQLS